MVAAQIRWNQNQNFLIVQHIIQRVRLVDRVVYHYYVKFVTVHCWNFIPSFERKLGLPEKWRKLMLKWSSLVAYTATASTVLYVGWKCRHGRSFLPLVALLLALPPIHTELDNEEIWPSGTNWFRRAGSYIAKTEVLSILIPIWPWNKYTKSGSTIFKDNIEALPEGLYLLNH